MLARTHLMRIQRAMYDRLRDYARNYMGGLSPELKRYFLEYHREFQDFKSVSSKRELLAAFQNTNITFCGDYHTLSQAQRTVIRLLRDSLPALRKRRKEPILLLEMVGPWNNKHIAQFLAGELGEAAFLKAIAFQKNWGFDWDNYRGLFEFARTEGIRIQGINGPRGGKKPPTLGMRDKFAAKIIADEAAKNKNAAIFVLVGDLHLAQNHLPRQVKGELEKRRLRRKTLIIHQNNERFYWKLAERGMEQFVDVLKVRDGIYCVMNTPPWVKLQTHLRWHELTMEGPRPPRPSEWDIAYEDIDRDEDVREAVQLIRRFFSLPEVADDAFSLVGPSDLSFLGAIRDRRLLGPEDLRHLARYIDQFKSQFIPHASLIYLSSLSINHAAAQAAIYLHNRLTGFDRVFQKPSTDFYRFVWLEALGFLGSKIINHKRKCNGIKNLEGLSQMVTPKVRRHGPERLAELVTGHVRAEVKARGKRRSFRFPLPKTSSDLSTTVFYYKAAKLLGALLGQALYSAVIEGNVPRDDVKALFLTPFHKKKDDAIRALYLSWIDRLDHFQYRELDKTETL
jgi:hypothetical protein